MRAVSAAATAVLLCCAADSRQPRRESGVGYDSLSLYAEFTYLPHKETMRLSVYPDSTTLTRRDSSGSLLSTARVANGDSARLRLDSARAYVARLRPATYRKEPVLDGTHILIRSDGAELFCDNCLHHFVLEAAGVDVPRHSATDLLLRTLVRQVSELAMAAEGPPAGRQPLLELVLDKRAMRDTTRSYEVDTLR